MPAIRLLGCVRASLKAALLNDMQLARLPLVDRLFLAGGKVNNHTRWRSPPHTLVRGPVMSRGCSLAPHDLNRVVANPSPAIYRVIPFTNPRS